MECEGKVALITGAGSGIGRATALALAARRVKRIEIVDINAEGAAETARHVAALGVEAQARIIDVTDPDALIRLFETVAAEGPLDIVFNNAGMVTGEPNFPDAPIGRLVKIVDLNLTAVLLGTQLAVQIMRGRGGGVVINTCSTVVEARSFVDIAYTTTKSAVLTLTECCAPFKERYNVRVNAVLPGLTATPILATTGPDGARHADWMKPLVDAGLPLPPEAIAEAVIALIEDETKAGDHVAVRNPVPPALQDRA